VGLTYTHFFTAGGAFPPIVWSISAGVLPNGLTLNTATGEVTGTPSLAGTYTFTVQVVDNNNQIAHVVCSIKITHPVAAGFGGAGGFRPAPCGCDPAQLQAEILRAARAQRKAWPYVHVFPAIPDPTVQVFGTVAAPAVNATALVLAYKVPSGMRFYLQGLIQVVSGVGFNPGDALWTVDVNTPIGQTNFQAFGVQGLVKVPVPLGSSAFGRFWPLPRAYEFAALDLIQSKVFNVGLAGGEFASGFFGYLEPVG
jgi:hypothetical protein